MQTKGRRWIRAFVTVVLLAPTAGVDAIRIGDNPFFAGLAMVPQKLMLETSVLFGHGKYRSEGLRLAVGAGDSGALLSAGYGVFEKGDGGFAAWSLDGVFVRTWNDPLWTRPQTSFVGVQGRLDIMFVNARLGVLFPVQGREERVRWLLGIGVEY